MDHSAWLWISIWYIHIFSFVKLGKRMSLEPSHFQVVFTTKPSHFICSTTDRGNDSHVMTNGCKTKQSVMSLTAKSTWTTVGWLPGWLVHWRYIPIELTFIPKISRKLKLLQNTNIPELDIWVNVSLGNYKRNTPIQLQSVFLTKCSWVQQSIAWLQMYWLMTCLSFLSNYIKSFTIIRISTFHKAQYFCL